MAVTVVASGSQTTVIATEHSLHTSTLARTFVLLVDAGAMLNGDRIEIQMLLKVLSASVIKTAYFATFSNVQSVPIKISLPIVSPGFGAEFTLNQISGTSRQIDWSVLSVG